MPESRGSTLLHNAAEYGVFLALWGFALCRMNFMELVARLRALCLYSCMQTVYMPSLEELWLCLISFCASCKLQGCKAASAGYGHDQAVKILLEH